MVPADKLNIYSFSFVRKNINLQRDRISKKYIMKYKIFMYCQNKLCETANDSLQISLLNGEITIANIYDSHKNLSSRNWNERVFEFETNLTTIDVCINKNLFYSFKL